MAAEHNVVFGVFTGYYSDWQIVGYFPDALSAHKYCEMRNKGKGNTFYVREVRRIQADLSAVPDGWFRYMFYYHWNKVDREWVRCKAERPDWDDEDRELEDWEIAHLEEEYFQGFRHGVNETNVIVNDYGVVIVTVDIAEYDTMEAIKMADAIVCRYDFQLFDQYDKIKRCGAKKGLKWYVKDGDGGE